MNTIRIGYVGTDGRSFLAALETSRATSELYPGSYRGVVVRGTPAMPPFAARMGWPVEFLPVPEHAVPAYAEALTAAFREETLDYALIMPEALVFDGLVDKVAEAGFGDRLIGLTQAGAFLEADKIAAKHLCREAGIPVAPDWRELDARDYRQVLTACLEYVHAFGGAVLKYPYSAGGKGARVILDAWQIREVYDSLMADYKQDYIRLCGKKGPWPLLLEARMSGVEISFTILVDKAGHHQILPTAMDYPERFAAPPGPDNPITGGMGSISPHPLESPELLELADRELARPLVAALKAKGLLRPCVLYPGCFVSFGADFRPTAIRVCEILVTGPGGPKQQKGYPWSLTKGEPLEIDFDYFEKKRILVVPSAMDWEEGRFKSDGSRVAYLLANGTVKPGESPARVAETLRQRLLSAFDGGRIRVIPRENPAGNRLDLRRDIGLHYLKAESLRAV
jgi:phosphoribosylamine--glycine ligase